LVEIFDKTCQEVLTISTALKASAVCQDSKPVLTLSRPALTLEREISTNTLRSKTETVESFLTAYTQHQKSLRVLRPNLDWYLQDPSTVKHKYKVKIESAHTATIITNI
jgi:hypothetical protein